MLPKQANAGSELAFPTANITSGNDIETIGILDMMVPPLGALGLFVLVLLIYSACTQPLWWKSRKRKHPATILDPKTNTPPDDFICSAADPPLMTEDDDGAVQRFLRYQNAPRYVLLVALPTILTLALCPLTLLINGPMQHFFWPHRDMPNINDAISCFLTPAGLVYAISFGFAFQESQNKQNDVDKTFKSLITTMKKILILANTKTMTIAQRKYIQYFLKEEVMFLIHVILKTPNRDGWTRRTERYEEITDITEEKGQSYKKQQGNPLQHRLLNEVLHLYTQLSDPANVTSPSLNILYWIFLELLGFSAFFGILMIYAGSPRLQLTMCMLTVFTISMFCYVLADLDQPHHGVFRVDLTILVSFLEQLKFNSQRKIPYLGSDKH